MSDAVNAPGSNGNGQEDDLVLAELRALGSRLDPVPEEAVAAARSAIAWRTMDCELAELVAEASDAELAHARGTDTPRLLAFESAHLAVEIEVRHTAAGLSVLGQIVPPQLARVEVRHQGRTISVTADEAGRFIAAPIAAGPASVRCMAGDDVVETDWFLA